MIPIRISLTDIYAVCAGAVLPLAFAPFNQWFAPAPVYLIAVLSLAYLFYLWQTASLAQASRYGFLFGLGYFSVGVWWVYISFYYFGGLPALGAGALAAAFVLILAMYPALMGTVIRRFFPQQDHRYLLILPSLWVIVEWIRGWLFTGFPWLSIGYSHIDSPLQGLAPVVGVYGMSFAVAYSAAALVYIWLKRPRRVLVIISVCVIWGGSMVLSTVAFTEKQAKPLDVALIQANVSQEFKWVSRYIRPSIERYLNLSAQENDADIIIWPETAIPLFQHQAGEYLEQIKQRDPAYLIGIPVLNENGEYFNSVMHVQGKEAFYFKHHLVPFGEYIPFYQWFDEFMKLLKVPMANFSAGAVRQPTLDVKGEKIGVSICYEDAFANRVLSSLPEASLLVNVSNDAWFGDSIAPHQHLEMARMRALESGRYLLRATNTGISAVINAQGKIIAQSPQFEVHSLRARAYPYHGSTPYVYWGDTMIISLLVLLIIAYYFSITRFLPRTGE